MSSQPKWSLGSWAYEWNANGSLKKVQRPDGSVITFKYDAFGRRISKSYHRREFLYIWDKNVPLHEIQKEELCEDNIITWIFEGFTPTAKLINGKAYSIISDHIGTPLMAIDTQGNKVWERELDIYGRVRKEFTSDDVANRRSGFMPFLYAGQYYDKETELAYNRFRYYDPNIGSYISQDPIGLLGNNPNIDAYVWDTNTWVDIFGLDAFGVNQDVYALYNKNDVINGIPIEGAKPYYIGISKNSNIRLGQHMSDGRFDPTTDIKIDLHKDLDYAKARAYEQYYIEKYETIDKNNPKSNQQNSFRHNRTDVRGEAFEAEYKKIKCV